MHSSTHRLGLQLHVLYLLTASDLVAVLIPQTLFVCFSALSGQFVLDRTRLTLEVLCTRLPYVVSWIWLHLLVLDLANQRLPDSVAEDRLNKPWRPIPAGHLTSSGARDLLVCSITLTFMLSVLLLGGVYETLLLFALNWIYNDLGLANGHWLLRNLMNALGITTIGAGALDVAHHCGLPFDAGTATDRNAAYPWFMLCASVLMTTIHAQDLYDQVGDAARGRSTAPLVLGDTAARWSIVAAVLTWSVAVPAVLGLRLPDDWIAYVVPACAGLATAARLLMKRGVSEDKITFKFWALWCVILYALPLAK
ncbi:hypothetical protein PG999_007886 [Apiospora kogelbergensis]|uniref:Digeranylgeranylglyceryl phosphate synthase n=1 Tax=Apiospora kogelbergensis TaxID=1337665 RepID=A0AAW0QT29_9PEZI